MKNTKKKELTFPSEGQLIERMSSIAEELEDLVQISKGKFNEVSAASRLHGSGAARFSSLIFKEIVLKHLVRGRLRTSVYYTGKDIAGRMSLKTPQEITAAAERYGLGRVTFSKFDLDHAAFTIHDSATSRDAGGVRRPICFFEAGFVAAALESLRRAKTHIVETKCRAMGADACHFHLADDAKTGDSEFSEENLRLLTSLAAHSITAIENALLYEKTKRQVTVDSLTHVLNHRFFQTSLLTECHRAQRYGHALSLLMLDVDDFKRFNDRFGHPKGDRVLKWVAQLLVRSVRDVDLVARYGGDEFAIILPQTDMKGVEVVASRIRKLLIEGPRAIPEVPITLSIGTVTVASKGGLRPASMIRIADFALLRAKRKGKNGVVCVQGK